MSETATLRPEDLTVRPPFSDLFSIDPRDLAAVTESVRAEGFRRHQPIIAWRASPSELVVIDGHTRLKAAVDAGIAEVPVATLQFPDEDAALLYAYRQQKERRNVSEHTLYEVFKRVDKRKTQDGRPNKETVSRDTVSHGPSRDETAAKLGVSPSTVSRMRVVHDYTEKTGDTSIEEKLKAGEVSINGAATQVGLRRSPEIKAAIVLPENADLSHSELAEKLGVGLNVVKGFRKRLGLARPLERSHRADDRRRREANAPESTLPPGREPEEYETRNGRKVRSVAIDLGYEAVNCLTRIPANDPNRKRGLQIVSDWIRRNQ